MSPGRRRAAADHLGASMLSTTGSSRGTRFVRPGSPLTDGVALGMLVSHSIFGQGPEVLAAFGALLILASVVIRAHVEWRTASSRSERVERLSRDLIERRLVGELVTCVPLESRSTRKQPFTTDLGQSPGQGVIAEMAAHSPGAAPRKMWVLTHTFLVSGKKPVVVLTHPEAPDVGVLDPLATPEPGLEDNWWRVLRRPWRDALVNLAGLALGVGAGVLIAYLA